jgi:hypothetical protein
LLVLLTLMKCVGELCMRVINEGGLAAVIMLCTLEADKTLQTVGLSALSLITIERKFDLNEWKSVTEFKQRRHTKQF